MEEHKAKFASILGYLEYLNKQRHPLLRAGDEIESVIKEANEYLATLN